MGLDSVELVMAFEQRFGIDIPDKDAVNLRTARHVTDYLYSRLSHAVNPLCTTQRAFYRARRAITEVLSVDRRVIAPDTRIESLVPKRDRRGVWRALASASGVSDWPPLVRPSSVVIALAVLPATVGLGLWAWLQASFLISLFGPAVTLAAGAALTIPLQVRISGRWPTVGGVAEYLATQHPAAVLGPSPGWTRDQVRQLVRATVIEELGISPAFDDNAEFVRDLGID